jgi:DDE superfamily endonuclease
LFKVVYKAANTYHSWTERGPVGASYSASKSGWFDGFQYEKWFFEIFLPNAKRKPGKKVLICDNLSCHISAAVIDACRQHNIAYVCLPPNSTDKLQPLDVGVFGPLKSAWKGELTDYKGRHPNQAGVPKTDFPRLLERTFQRANPGNNLPAAFEKCGLYPVNVNRAVERVPHREMDAPDTIRELLNSTLGEKLDQLRGTASDSKKKQRGKKITVPAGKSYSAVAVDEEMEAEDDGLVSENEEEMARDFEDSDDEEPRGKGQSRGKGKGKGPAKGRGKGRGKGRVMGEFSSIVYSEDEEEEMAMIRQMRKSRRIVDSDEEDEEELDSDVPDRGGDQANDGASGSWRGKPAGFEVGSFVVAVYDKVWYLAQVEGEEPEEETVGFTLLRYMERRGKNQFVWGQVPDRLKTVDSDILLRVEPPIPISSRHYGLPKDILKEVEKLFRVLWSIIFYFSNYRYLKMKTGVAPAPIPFLWLIPVNC